MVKDITRSEFYQKYGDVEVMFSEYYKYVFTYNGMLPDGKSITVEYGGDSSYIYRHRVLENFPETISSLSPFKGSVYDGKELIEIFYDY